MTPAEFKAARLALGLTQGALAHRLGTTWSTLHRWEIGAVPVNPIAANYITHLLEEHTA